MKYVFCILKLRTIRFRNKDIYLYLKSCFEFFQGLCSLPVNIRIPGLKSGFGTAVEAKDELLGLLRKRLYEDSNHGETCSYCCYKFCFMISLSFKNLFRKNYVQWIADETFNIVLKTFLSAFYCFIVNVQNFK